jgi:thiamine pyrophosphokinase
MIFANGELPYLEKARLLLQPDDYMICADGGTRHALALGLTPHLVIGDMDSINKGEWQDFEKSGVSVELFPQDKNETDLELAIHRALELDAEEVIIIGALGGRLDQTLGNIALLATPPGNSRNIRIDDGVEEIFFCRNQAQVHGRNGDIVSLIPWGNPVHGIQTEGLKWTLHSESLYPEKTRGISNEMIREVANIKISSGVLLIVHTRRLSIRNRKS